MYNHQTSKLRKLMSDTADLKFSGHALRQMKERGISIPDVRHVLTKGQVRGIEPHIKSGNDVWNVEGGDLDGGSLRVCIDPTEVPIIHVVTAIKKKTRKN